MIKDLINRHNNYNISFYTRSATLTNGIEGTPTYTLYKTIKGIYWKASGNKNNISERFREQVDAVIIVDPADISESAIADDMKITISGVGDFSLVYPDNIAGQNKVLQLNVKQWQ